MSIPVFHDDQHGTAIVVGAAIWNALKVVGKKIEDVRLVTSGAGAAALACLDLLVSLGLPQENITATDKTGVIRKDRAEDMDPYKARYAQDTDARTLADVIEGADIFLGLSAPGVLKPAWVKKMAKAPIIMALANPTPEIMPDIARKARSDAIIATGRSDYPNQVNNVLCFPFLFRGALDVGATTINEEMKITCVKALADLAEAETSEVVQAAFGGHTTTFGPEKLIPKPFDPRLIVQIAPAVAKAAMDSGVATRPIEDFDAYRAGSTGRRNTFSLTGLQALVQSFGGSSPSEGLAGPCIERVSNNCEYVRTVCAQIGSFREVLSKQSIGVLVRSALPRAVRFAEVDGKAGCDPQIRMPGHLCSLVPGQRAAKLRWQCRDRPGDGIANRFSPMTGKRRPVLHARDGAVAFHSGKMQQHCEPRGAFHQSADRRSAQADDQVTFPVSGYGPISCFRRSFTVHDLRRDEGFSPPAATCPRYAQCPSRAKAGGQLTTECAAALYVERLIDRLMTDPHRLILGPVPRIVDPKTVRDLLRTPGPGPSPVLPRPMPTTVPDDAWPLDHRSIRCRDPTRKPILHIAPQRLIRCQLGWLRPFGGPISMPLRRRCSVVQATASGRRIAPHLAGDRRRYSLQPASNMTYASSLGAQKSNLLTFLERQVTS